MEVVTTLDGKDYKNLQIKYSDKNVIYNIQGRESIVQNAESAVLNPTNPDGQNPYVLNIVKDTMNFDNFVVRGGKASIGLVTKTYLRVEEGTLSGSFSIDVNEIISDYDSISVGYNIYYNEYISGFVDLINKNNYNSIDDAYFKLTKGTPNNQTPLITDTYMPSATSKIKQSVTGKTTTFPMSWRPATYVKQQIIRLPDGATRIKVDFSLLIYTGQNEINALFNISKKVKNIARLANKIEFTVKSNIIDVQQITFDFNSPFGNDTTANYELSTNELLQTTETENITDKKSYKICQDIFNEYKKDKQIISFDLLNIKKYNIGEQIRFLDVEDCFYIKDEIGNYVGEYYNEQGELVIPKYKIIGLQKKWDGSLYYTVTAIQENY